MKKYILIILVLGLVIFSGCSNKTPDEKNTFTSSLSNSDKKVTVYKSPTCGCCGGYINELEKNGYEVKVVKEENMNLIKKQFGIPINMESCHTSVFENGYIVEGHVPLEAVEKLLVEKPSIRGIALPEMPSGTPGMPGPKRGNYEIHTLGNTSNIFVTI